MRKRSKAVIWLIIIGMALFTGSQYLQVSKKKGAPANALVMLYEASLFQVELLSGLMSEAAGAGSTDQLTGLQQAAYSAEYTHKKLLSASADKLPELRSVSALMEWTVRLQIGGFRSLKAQEAQLFKELVPLFDDLHTGYALLMNGDGSVDPAAYDQLAETDRNIAELLRSFIQ